ncbi:hypothetical protein DFJ73DRAFT_829011 [Zopfochytrium polystomum]|nr:hypothetical protein DFJ73DRAFT_829011 [Zopfochytrium polystomum]
MVFGVCVAVGRWWGGRAARLLSLVVEWRRYRGRPSDNETRSAHRFHLVGFGRSGNARNFLDSLALMSEVPQLQYFRLYSSIRILLQSPTAIRQHFRNKLPNASCRRQLHSPHFRRDPRSKLCLGRRSRDTRNRYCRTASPTFPRPRRRAEAMPRLRDYANSTTANSAARAVVRVVSCSSPSSLSGCVGQGVVAAMT